MIAVYFSGDDMSHKGFLGKSLEKALKKKKMKKYLKGIFNEFDTLCDDLNAVFGKSKKHK
jgi:hypothetical protein